MTARMGELKHVAKVRLASHTNSGWREDEITVYGSIPTTASSKAIADSSPRRASRICQAL
ncbi:MAG: hypothetical protein HYX84_08265 [Chloroflexi bacterium]|nr:hypothetical protein [Chloroflexota bacterium]